MRSLSSPGFQIMRSLPASPNIWSSPSPPVSTSLPDAAEQQVRPAFAKEGVVARLAEQQIDVSGVPSGSRGLPINHLRPEVLEGGRVGRQREHLLDEPLLEPEQEHLVEVEPPAVTLSGGAIQGRRPVVAH